jgi:hypothetical protein
MMEGPARRGAVTLSDEDRAEMERLAQQALRALAEMSEIVGRALGPKIKPAATPRFQFTAHHRRVSRTQPEAAVLPQEEELHGVWEICGGAGCGCYDYDQGTCYPKGPGGC